MSRIAVIYYSATGNVHILASAIAEGAREAGTTRLKDQIAKVLRPLVGLSWGTGARTGASTAGSRMNSGISTTRIRFDGSDLSRERDTPVSSG